MVNTKRNFLSSIAAVICLGVVFCPQHAYAASSGEWTFAGLAQKSELVSAISDAQFETPAVVELYDDRAPVSANSAYLKAFENLSGRQLLDALHDSTGQNTAFHSYSEARNFMYSTADNVLVSGKRGVIAAYSNIFIEGTSGNGGQYKENGDANGDGFVDSSGVNAEHSWPQSFFRQALPMRVDLHHLQTTLQTPNNKRSSLPYTMVNSYQYSTNAGSKLGALGFEPCNSDKGNTARAMLYFMMRYHDQNIRSGGYDNAFWKEKVDLFLLWNRQDPPDANEARRNELIFKYQGNRNPFIDNPSLADKIGAEVWKSL